MSKSSNPIAALEMQEIIQKLIQNGFGDIVECLLEHHDECYTKKARLNKSATIRKLNCKGKQLEDALTQMREILKNEFDFDWPETAQDAQED